MKTTAQILRDYRGPALFSFGFRPFFLLAAIWSALSVAAWTAVVTGIAPAVLAVGRDWHVHEMLFGYSGAVIVGYMTVAGPNWTGRFPVAGGAIAALAGLWIAGRVALLAGDGPLSIAVDVAFLPLFAATLWREQVAARHWGAVAPAVAVTVLALADCMVHLRPAWPALGGVGERLALATITALIAMMGGRLVPSFTRNWMAKRGLGPEPRPPDRVDTAATALVAAALLGWSVAPEVYAVGLLLEAAALAALLRLVRWRGWRTVGDPLVAVLHLGYAWLVAGLALLGGAVLLPDAVPAAAALHALGAGAIGTMTVALMTRTTLSHTGRDRRAGPATVAIYGGVTAAAALRVAAAFAPHRATDLLAIAAGCWVGAFGLFVAVYGPILCRPWRRSLKTRRPAGRSSPS